ncbi:NAD(P)-dependent dehydrogenase (short-subunit alcohol dehydrogenase family) [Paenibacillus barcinonensis]|uniref:NAD(P)-dependent dehydrogenase (Short-subunit alcohol dehydrogenase family) n=2 Tax=Paenibacillus barcinonensis TaxID=198119 RepID=A0A2V4UST4_PAEBA|nr:NAD(P)-dependent dehydrogenase (short-subunit alcohol dehydrogenase family) [Paenibacillus barcinonensis]
MMGTGWTKDSMPDCSGKTVVITGANSGIGLEAAIAMAEKNATLVLAVRNMDKGQSALAKIKAARPEVQAELMKLDLADLESVRAFATACIQKYPSLDVLINNAGIMNTPYRLTKDGFESQFGSNHLGHFALTGLLLPRLMSTPASRVVTLSSIAAHNGRIDFNNLDGAKGYSSWKFYGQSKLANMLFARELNNKLAEHGLNTISVACHPGFANTNLMSFNSGKRANPFIRLVTNLVSQSAYMGALPTLYSAVSPNIKGGEYIGPDGRGGRKGYPTNVPIIDRLYDAEVSHRLWDVSEKLTGVTFSFEQQ